MEVPFLLHENFVVLVLDFNPFGLNIFTKFGGFVTSEMTNVTLHGQLNLKN